MSIFTAKLSTNTFSWGMLRANTAMATSDSQSANITGAANARPKTNIDPDCRIRRDASTGTPADAGIDTALNALNNK